MTNKSQKDRVIKRILDTGKITRNECLRNYISRLGAIICTLKKEGWDFRTEWEGGDFVYTMIRCPLKKEVLKNPVTGALIVRYK